MAVRSLCKRFAEILGGEASVINGVCSVMRSRTNIRPVVLGKRARYPVTFPFHVHPYKVWVHTLSQMHKGGAEDVDWQG
jgi:hypothetical protein